MNSKTFYRAAVYAAIVLAAYSVPILSKAPAKLVLLNKAHGRLVMEDGVRRWESRKAGSDSVDIILHSVSSNYSGKVKMPAGRPGLEQIAASAPAQSYESEDTQQQYPRAA